MIKGLLWGALAALIAGLGLLAACGGGGGSTGGAVPGGGGGGAPPVIAPGVVVPLPPPTLAVSCTNTSGALNLTAGALRATGVAPLAVYFDATATTSTTTRPFHDIEYRWDFGDPGSGTWAEGSRPGVSSKDQATGAVAAHIFETPGPYTITVTAFDGVNTATCNVAITVQDPNVVFAGANTVCIANVTATAGAAGCPVGAATPAGTADFTAAIAACAGANKRCLFNRGDTFAAGAPATISVAGPMTIGAYPLGGVGLPNVTSANVAGVLRLASAAADVRLMELNVTGSGVADTGTAINVATDMSNLALLRLTISDIGTGIVVQTGASISGSVVQENTITNIHRASGGVGFFGKAVNSAILGNSVGPFGATAEHNVRVQPGQRVAISNNTMTTPGTSGKTALTIRAADHLTGASSDAVNDTQFIYISDNKVMGGASSVQIFQVGPASNGQNNWIFDVIAERNWIVFGPVSQQGLFSEATRLTVRNNICDATGGAPGGAGRTCYSNDRTNTAGAPVPDNNVFYNNTCYSGDASVNPTCIALGFTTGAPITNTTVANNLAYAPLATTPRMLVSTVGVTGTTGASGTFGNSSNAQVLGTDPNFLNGSGLFNTPLDFKLPPAGSYAIGLGVDVPVWSDFFRAVPPVPRDSGAANH